MRRQWSVRRTRQPEPDGQRRWDRAYQEVLAWTEAAASGEALAAAPRKPPQREVPDESGSLRPGLDAAPSASKRTVRRHDARFSNALGMMDTKRSLLLSRRRAI